MPKRGNTMKVYQLMAALSYKAAGDEVVLYCYGENFNADITVVDYDKFGRVAISCNKESFERYDKKHYGEEPTSDGE